jgi:bifunctional non-homologous end joining protein LigD
MPHLVEAMTSLECASATIDAELVASDDKGVADFAALHVLMSRRREDGLTVWAFDLMMLDGEDLRPMPYVERKAKLATLVQRSRIGCLYHSETFADGEKLLAEGCQRRLEGIVSKRRDSQYRSGKSSAWIKVKCAAWREANRDRHELFERA